MTTILSPFVAPSRKGDTWFFAGLTSSFPNLTDSGSHIIYESQVCGNEELLPGCKVFNAPSDDTPQAREVEGDEVISHNGIVLQDQVLIFQYKGKIHAIDNVSRRKLLADVMMLSLQHRNALTHRFR